VQYGPHGAGIGFGNAFYGQQCVVHGEVRENGATNLPAYLQIIALLGKLYHEAQDRTDETEEVIKIAGR
jgi:hypothetical protein